MKPLNPKPQTLGAKLPAGYVYFDAELNVVGTTSISHVPAKKERV